MYVYKYFGMSKMIERHVWDSGVCTIALSTWFLLISLESKNALNLREIRAFVRCTYKYFGASKWGIWWRDMSYDLLPILRCWGACGFSYFLLEFSNNFKSLVFGRGARQHGFGREELNFLDQAPK